MNNITGELASEKPWENNFSWNNLIWLEKMNLRKTSSSGPQNSNLLDSFEHKLIQVTPCLINSGFKVCQKKSNASLLRLK